MTFVSEMQPAFAETDLANFMVAHRMAVDATVGARNSTCCRCSRFAQLEKESICIRAAESESYVTLCISSGIKGVYAAVLKVLCQKEQLLPVQ